MARTRHTEEQIIAVLKDAQAGVRFRTFAGSTASRMPPSINGSSQCRTSKTTGEHREGCSKRPDFSPARPESAKTDSLPWDVPCPE